MPLISQDCPCPGCGYNVRGLTPQDSCPECHRPVAQALNRVHWGHNVPNEDLPRLIAILFVALGLLAWISTARDSANTTSYVVRRRDRPYHHGTLTG